MVELNFTNEQRFIIALLCDLYKEPSKRELDPNLVATAIYGGHDWALTWQYSGIFPGEPDSRNHVSFVTDTLDMWSHIEHGYSKLSPEDKEKVKAAVPYLGEEPQFTGFDGNNEAEFMSIAWMMVDQMGRFSNFKGRSFNSHMPKVARYRDMLAVWPDVRATLHKVDMTADQLVQLLSRD